jgi:hypothetical protein
MINTIICWPWASYSSTSAISGHSHTLYIVCTRCTHSILISYCLPSLRVSSVSSQHNCHMSINWQLMWNNELTLDRTYSH